MIGGLIEIRSSAPPFRRNFSGSMPFDSKRARPIGCQCGNGHGATDHFGNRTILDSLVCPTELAARAGDRGIGQSPVSRGHRDRHAFGSTSRRSTAHCRRIGWSPGCRDLRSTRRPETPESAPHRARLVSQASNLRGVAQRVTTTDWINGTWPHGVIAGGGAAIHHSRRCSHSCRWWHG